MTDTVRVMPRQPIEAKSDEFGEGYYTERGTSIVHRDYLNSGGVGWVEVSDPIVWDGTDETLFAVRATLPDPAHAYQFAAYVMAISLFKLPLAGDGTNEPPLDDLLMVPLEWRIQIVGDSFVILPPKDGE